MTVKGLRGLLLLAITVNTVIAQQNNSFTFQKHGFKKNTLAGHEWVYEIPLDISQRIGGDLDYDSTEARNPLFIGAGLKIGLKNALDRGIAVGAGMDWNTNKYFRINFYVDLDFLLHHIDLSNKKRFGGSALSKWMFSTVVATREGVEIKEYYLKLQFMQFHFRGLSFNMGNSIGLFRRKHHPYFADAGLYYGITYSFGKW